MGKKHRDKLAKGFGTAEQCVATHGPDARCELQLLSQAPDVLPHSEVQNLLLWCLHPELGHMPRWVMVRNRPLLRGALVLYVPGLDAAGLRSLQLEGGVQRLVRTPKSPSSRTAQAWAAELLRVNVGRKRKAPGDEPDPSALPSPHQHPTGAWYASYVEQFALTEHELRMNGYPAVGGGRDGPAGAAAATGAVSLAAPDQPPGVVSGGTCPTATPIPALGTEGGASSGGVSPARLLSIDCEMCLVGESKQLARVAVVDEGGATLLDEIVIPEQEVTDHLTRFSGITPALLATATTSAAAVRARLLALIGQDPLTYLVGHSLENDLEALGIAHPRVLDTALLFPLRYNGDGKPAKNSLRALSARFLRREIQQSPCGHDPSEDASAAMQLARLKLARGLLFGMPGGGDDDADFETLFGALGLAGWRCSAFDSGARRDAAGDRVPDAGDEASDETPSCDETAFRLAAAAMQQPRPFGWLPLRELAAAQGCHAAHSAALAALCTRLSHLCAQLPPNTLLMLVGCGRASAPGLGCVSVTVSAGQQAGAAGDTACNGALAATPAPTPPLPGGVGKSSPHGMTPSISDASRCAG
jgi:RNA exonuclease 1